jgi:hypothetical protein
LLIVNFLPPPQLFALAVSLAAFATAATTTIAVSLFLWYNVTQLFGSTEMFHFFLLATV